MSDQRAEIVEPAPSERGRMRSRMRSAWAQVQGSMQLHGVWAPGVRLMRNLSIARKAALIVAGMVLPLLLLAGLVLQHWLGQRAEMGRAMDGLQRQQALAAEGLALTQWVGQVAEQGAGTSSAAARAAIANERVQLAQLQAAVRDSLGAGPGAARLKAFETARERLLASLQADGVLDGVTLDDSLRQLDALRLQAEVDWQVIIDADGDARALRGGLLELGARLQGGIARMAEAGARLRAGADRSQAEELREHLAAARLMQELTQDDLDLLRARERLDTAALESQQRRVDAFLTATARLAGQVLRAPPSAAGAAPTVDTASSQALVATALQATGELQAMALRGLEQRLRALRAERDRAALAAGFAALLVFGIGAYLLVCAYKVMAGGLKELSRQLEALGQGDLSIRPRGLGADEFGRALTTLGQSAAQMSELFEAVTRGVSAVSHASREVATGNAGLSARSGEISSAIGGVAERAQGFSAAMDACGQQVEEAADHVRTMRLEAQRSRKAMAGVRERMRALQGKSGEIGQVVRMMETVAFQTKLLSLNASVEAARAGLQGKGFAVVAQEVRALARRSEESARRIQEIIGGSLAEIEQGTLMAERLDAAVRQTDEAIVAVDRIMGDIVQLTREGVGQSQEVLRITRQVETTVGGNARLVEQLSEASIALRGQGDALKRSVNHFVLG